MKRTEAHHKVRFKKSAFYKRTWAEAIDVCIGTNTSTWNWQCGINGNRINPDGSYSDYILWEHRDRKIFVAIVPKGLNEHIEKICIERRFIP